MQKLTLVFVALALMSGLGVAENYADLQFTVLAETSGKPMRNASVILHQLNKNGKQERNSGLQLKTDDKGKAEFRGAPYGKLRIQVLARGYQTFGQDVNIDESTEQIEIKMKDPQKQYSIYEDQEKK